MSANAAFQYCSRLIISRRIHDNDYEFPGDRAVSTPVKELIQSILTPDPSQRPSLHEIVDHYWFTAGTVPSYIPISAHDAPPDFRHVARHMSESWSIFPMGSAEAMESEEWTALHVFMSHSWR